MKYHELDANKAKNRKRVGRGISAGQGKTAGRGTKGQGSRTGKKLSAVFMGGQGALVQRIPKKRGFKSLRAPAQIIYTQDLNLLEGKSADNQTLFEAGLIGTPYHTVKIILKGDVTKAIDINTQAISKGALEAVTKAGGSFKKTEVAIKPSTKPQE